ncbi:MAG: SDR family oxidoreductase [Bacteroidota bacterium]|jgi:UDP-glucose 4-epimerase
MSLYLVTGGAGFIGSHITEELLHRGERVRVLDNFSTGKRENLHFPHLQTQVKTLLEIVEGDIREPDSVRAAMQGIDYVLHQAALPSIARSVADPITSNDVNVNGTLNVLVAARDAKVKLFVYASSSSIYGNTSTLPKHEKMQMQPISPYAVSKLAGERYCVAFHNVYKLPIVCLRYFNVFGPRQDPNSQYSGVIPKFITAMLRGEAPVIYGDGMQSRDFTYVENIVKANLLACKRQEAIGHVINIAGGESYTLLDLYHNLAGLIGRTCDPIFSDARIGDIKHSFAAIELAKLKLGYIREIDWLIGLRKTVDWYSTRN